MASRDRLADAAARRAELLTELGAVDAELRELAVQAIADGQPAARVAKAAGVSRETLYKWLRADGVATEALALERRLRTRLAELDGRWNELVERVMAREKMPVEAIRLEAAKRNAQAGKRRRKGLPPLPTISDDLRAFAEAKILRLVDDRPGEPVLRVVGQELDEAWTIRQRLQAIEEGRAGF